DKPEGELSAAINDQFGSFDAFRAHFNSAATTIQGSGWAILSWDVLGQRLVIEQLYDQQGNVPLGSHPLLMLDRWEHAFYLQYKNVRADYAKAFWNVVSWADVQKRFDAARKVTLSWDAVVRTCVRLDRGRDRIPEGMAVPSASVGPGEPVV